MKIEDTKCCSLLYYNRKEKIIKGLISNYYKKHRYKDLNINPVIVFVEYELTEVSDLYDFYIQTLNDLDVKRIAKMFEAYPHNYMRKELEYFKENNIDYEKLVSDIKETYTPNNITIGAMADKFVEEDLNNRKSNVIITSIEDLSTIKEISNIYDIYFLFDLDDEKFMRESIRIAEIVNIVISNTNRDISNIGDDKVELTIAYNGNGHEILEMMIRHNNEIKLRYYPNFN